MRYAADHPVTAARERFPGRMLTADDGDLWLVRLDGRPSALHLTHRSNLDALGLDDRISTGRLDLSRPGRTDALLDTCGALSDALYDWWDAAPPPIVYRSRTSPSHRNIAFTQNVSWTLRSDGKLRDATILLAALVLRHGFTVPDSWLRT